MSSNGENNNNNKNILPCVLELPKYKILGGLKDQVGSLMELLNQEFLLILPVVIEKSVLFG